MMVTIKNKVALQKMRIAGQLLAEIFLHIEPLIGEGVSTLAINDAIERRMRSVGLKPECIGYGSYRHATCISVNDVVVHGIPSESILLKQGDVVKIDVVGSYKGYCADMARCFFVGDGSMRAKDMVHVAQKALDRAIDMVRPGAKLSDICAEIQKIVEAAGYGVVRRFAGHGIGKHMHEYPDVPNYRFTGKDVVLREGMTLAIEPMITEGSYEVVIDRDGWTARTKDGGLAAHVEDTVAVVAGGAEVLTRSLQEGGEKNP